MAPKNIKSFGDLGGDDSGSDHDDDHNDYYAGGKASGQLIRGAPEDKGDKVSGLFDKARKAGAVDGTSEDLDEPSSAFRGKGHTLAGGVTTQQSSGQSKHVITFFRNGFFTVNDGPGRNVNDPANFKFIDSISKGECPEELEPSDPGKPVDVNLLRRDEDWSEPDKPKYAAFQGSGRTLAGPSTSSSAVSSAAVAASSSAAAEGEWQGVDESKPTTSLQLRMADGSRMVARFNHSHKVSDIRRFIRASRPDVVVQYQLMTAFPSQPIQEEGKTLEEAGLLNAVIIQKLV